jgi:hypothetical protein
VNIGRIAAVAIVVVRNEEGEEEGSVPNAPEGGEA